MIKLLGNTSALDQLAAEERTLLVQTFASGQSKNSVVAQLIKAKWSISGGPAVTITAPSGHGLYGHFIRDEFHLVKKFKPGRLYGW